MPSAIILVLHGLAGQKQQLGEILLCAVFKRRTIALSCVLDDFHPSFEIPENEISDMKFKYPSALSKQQTSGQHPNDLS